MASGSGAGTRRAALILRGGAAMAQPRSDEGVLHHIEQLVEEEHALLSAGARDDVERKRLTGLRVELDQCWDLLRQRRAKREFGQDPGEAEVRPPSVVESYEQ
jgi:hypothetical protein